MSDRHLEKLHKRLVMAPKKNTFSKSKEEASHGQEKKLKRPCPETVDEVADYFDDEHAFQEIKTQMTKQSKKMKKIKKVEPVEHSNDSSDMDDADDEREDSQDVVQPLDRIEDLESKPLDTLATCFFKDIWQEDKKYTFVYLKRMGKCVNVQMTAVPWLIQKLSYYFSIRGTDLVKALAALNDGRNRILQAMRDAKIENVDLVKELKISDTRWIEL